MRNFFLSAITLFIVGVLQAQLTADQILDKSFEMTGGKDKWEQLQGIKITGKSNAQGMEIPIEIVSMKDGKQYVKIEVQGKELKMTVFDGDIMWNTNFMTMKPEKVDDETLQNFKNGQMNDFPSPFLNYKEKGYQVELIGEENFEGTDCYKIKLTKKPYFINGEEYPNITFHFFDKDSFILLGSEMEVMQGPMKGNTVKSIFGDYQEVNGLYFPFSMGGAMMGGGMNVDKIEINPEIPNDAFIMPEESEDNKPAEKTQDNQGK